MPKAQSGSPAERGEFGSLLLAFRKRDGRSRLSLALDSGISSRHLGFLEVGRAMPSTAMVARLARTLQLTMPEHDRLLLAAGFAPRFASAGVGDGVTGTSGLPGARAFDVALALAASTSIARSTEIAQAFLAEFGITHFITGTLRRGATGWDIRRDAGASPSWDGCSTIRSTGIATGIILSGPRRTATAPSSGATSRSSS